MELLWLLFVTFVAVGAAYVVGGIIDRSSMKRREIREREERLIEIERTAQLMLNLSGKLLEQNLLSKENQKPAAVAAAKYLCRDEFTLDEISRIAEEILKL